MSDTFVRTAFCRRENRRGIAGSIPSAVRQSLVAFPGRTGLPDDRAHIIQTDGGGLRDDFGMEGDDFVPSIDQSAGELVADVDAQAASRTQHTGALRPDTSEVIEILVETLTVADLSFRAVVFYLPVGGRRNDKVYGSVRQRILRRASPWITRTVGNILTILSCTTPPANRTLNGLGFSLKNRSEVYLAAPFWRR